jgi:ribosome-associated translation inhibitor RaiA
VAFPIQICARDVSNREPIEALINERANRLERFHHRNTSARAAITVEGAHPSRHSFKLEIAIPGAEIVVERGPTPDLAHAIREGFDIARRQLEDRDPHKHHHISDKR